MIQRFSLPAECARLQPISASPSKGMGVAAPLPTHCMNRPSLQPSLVAQSAAPAEAIMRNTVMKQHVKAMTCAPKTDGSTARLSKYSFLVQLHLSLAHDYANHQTEFPCQKSPLNLLETILAALFSLVVLVELRQTIFYSAMTPQLTSPN